MNNIIDGDKNILDKKVLLNIKKDIIKLMALSDTHLGCMQDRVDYLKYFYKYAEANGVDIIIHCGDLTDGYLNFQDQVANLKYKTFDDQKNYVISVYPRSYIPTIMISGNHDKSWQNIVNLDIIKEIALERKDLYYLNSSSGIIQAGNFRIGLIHKGLKNIENSCKIVFKGHTHKFERIIMPGYKLIKLPCLVDFRFHPGMENRKFLLGVYIAEINIANEVIISNELIKCSKDGTKRVLRL